MPPPVFLIPGPLWCRIECGKPPTTMRGVIPQNREGRGLPRPLAISCRALLSTPGSSGPRALSPGLPACPGHSAGYSPVLPGLPRDAAAPRTNSFLSAVSVCRRVGSRATPCQRGHSWPLGHLPYFPSVCTSPQHCQMKLLGLLGLAYCSPYGCSPLGWVQIRRPKESSGPLGSGWLPGRKSCFLTTAALIPGTWAQPPAQSLLLPREKLKSLLMHGAEIKATSKASQPEPPWGPLTIHRQPTALMELKVAGR